MHQTQRQAAMGFIDERIPRGTHMCLIYDDENECLFVFCVGILNEEAYASRIKITKIPDIG